MFNGMNDRFINATDLFIDLLNWDAFDGGGPQGLVCHIGHKPARGVGWPFRHMFGNPFVQKVGTAGAHGSFWITTSVCYPS